MDSFSTHLILFYLWLYFNPYADGGLFGQYNMMQNTCKMTETLAQGY